MLDDQSAIDIVRSIQNPQDACKALIKEALNRYTNDNITAMVIRFKDVPSDILPLSVGTAEP